MTWSTPASSLILMLCLLGSGCKGRETSTVTTDLSKLHLQLADRSSANQVEFTPIKSVSALPETVRTRIGRDMANPGERFNATDVIVSDLPMRRLIFAGKSDRYYLVHYEVGGRGRYFVTALFELSGQQAIPLWASVSGEKYASMEQFNQAANSRMLKNQVAELFCKPNCD